MLVCDSVTDPSGNPLQADSRDFEILVRHRLMAGSFHEDLSPWQSTSGGLGEVLHSSEDAEASEASGSVEIRAASTEPIAIWQCVTPASPGTVRIGGRVRITSGDSESPVVRARVEAFAAQDCSGPPSAQTMSGIVSGHGDSWKHLIPGTFLIPEDSGSLLYSVLVEDAAGSVVWVDDVFMHDSALFADGFESGDTTAWSQ